MKKNKIILGLIILLAILLRFFYLGKIPNGLYSDEAAYGYNAYSLLKTGRDEYGTFIPLAFKSFGDYKAPLYIYFMVPFIKLFDLSVFGVRAQSAILSVIMVVLVYYLGQIISKHKTFSLLASFFTAISPLSLQFGRMAHENNLSVMLISLGVLFFLLSLRKSNFIYLSFISLALSIYAYHDARVLTPLLIMTLMILYRFHVLKNIKQMIFALLIFIALLLPLLTLLNNSNFWSRPKFTVMSSDKGINLETNQERGEDIAGGFFIPGLFHNKLLAFSRKFLDNYTSHFSFQFLFLHGDNINIYSSAGNGILYLTTFPFLFLGLYYLFKNDFEYRWLILLWLFLSPIPASLTKFVPSASRTLSILIPSSIIIAYGFMYSLKFFKALKNRRIYIVIILLVITIDIALYLHNYYFNSPIRYARDWHYGMDQVISKTKNIQAGYSKIWFSKNAWGYIYPLFYFKYPPEKYQSQAHLSSLNEFGFGWVNGFDKFIFADFPPEMLEMQDTLFIGIPSDFYKPTKPLDVVSYPDGKPAYYLADYYSFK